jgi:hypothetical protein
MAVGGFTVFKRTEMLLCLVLEWLRQRSSTSDALTAEIKGLLQKSCQLVGSVFILFVKPYAENV